MTSEATPLASTAGVASRKQRFIRVARLLVAVVSKRFHRKQTLEEAVTSDLCSGAHCLCENPDIVSFECDRVSYDVLLANDDALKLFATVVSTRRCSSLAAASVLTFMAKTLTDESSLESVASTLSDVVELCLCQLSRDCVESLLSEIPPHASLHYLTTTLLPRMDFECLHSVQVLELWDDVVEAGESFRSLTHLKLNDLSWSSVAASLENLALSTQLVALCVALKHRGPAHTPVCFRMVFPRLKYLEIDEAGLPASSVSNLHLNYEPQGFSPECWHVAFPNLDTFAWTLPTGHDTDRDHSTPNEHTNGDYFVFPQFAVTLFSEWPQVTFYGVIEGDRGRRWQRYVRHYGRSITSCFEESEDDSTCWWMYERN